MLALMRGELAEAERLVLQTMALQRRHGIAVHEDQLSVLIFTLRREQGRLAELGPVVSAFLQERTGCLGLAARIGAGPSRDRSAGRRARRVRADGDGRFRRHSRDGRWLFCMVYLSEVCAALGDAAQGS